MDYSVVWKAIGLFSEWSFGLCTMQQQQQVLRILHNLTCTVKPLFFFFLLLLRFVHCCLRVGRDVCHPWGLTQWFSFGTSFMVPGWPPPWMLLQQSSCWLKKDPSLYVLSHQDLLLYFCMWWQIDSWWFSTYVVVVMCHMIKKLLSFCLASPKQNWIPQSKRSYADESISFATTTSLLLHFTHTSKLCSSSDSCCVRANNAAFLLDDDDDVRSFLQGNQQWVRMIGSLIYTSAIRY